MGRHRRSRRTVAGRCSPGLASPHDLLKSQGIGGPRQLRSTSSDWRDTARWRTSPASRWPANLSRGRRVVMRTGFLRAARADEGPFCLYYRLEGDAARHGWPCVGSPTSSERTGDAASQAGRREMRVGSAAPCPSPASMPRSVEQQR